MHAYRHCCFRLTPVPALLHGDWPLTGPVYKGTVTQNTDPTIVSVPTSKSTNMHPPLKQQRYRSIT
jgi:hypothetical protein